MSPADSGAKAVRPGRLVELTEMVENPHTAAGAIPRIRQILADSLDAEQVPLVRGLLLTAMTRIDAPTGEIVKQADSLDRAMAPTDPRRIGFLSMTAEELVARGRESAHAVRFAGAAFELCPGDAKYAAHCSRYRTLLGRAQLLDGKPEQAIQTLDQAAAVAPDSQVALFHLGRAHEKLKHTDEAISCYIRSLSVFFSADSSAAPPLRALYRKRHGSLDGLEARLADARARSTQATALDAFRLEKPAPEWTLPDLDRREVHSSEFKGKVLLLLFWSASEGDCAEALYAAQNLYRDFKDRGLAAETINWERGLMRELRFDTARRAVTRLGVWLPVVVDDPHAVHDAYGVEDVPQFFLIDAEGLIRFRVPGKPDNLEAVLAAQIESLLEPAK